MGINAAQDWPVIILLGAVAFFFVYVIINSKQQERINKDRQGKGNDKV
jgi:hypothetical protein